MRKIIFTISILLLTISLVSAQEYSIDISGLSNEEYTLGEQITFKVLLLDGTTPITQQIDYKISDALNKKEITGQANSNEDISIKAEDDFPSGLWTIAVTYPGLEKPLERQFLIGEKSEVQFLIEGDKLIIRNTGNVRYTKTIQIKIGDETNSYAQNIKAGEEKVLRLISPEGTYNIEITDGTNKPLKRENIKLFGTGNVVGAIDEGLIGYTGFAGANDPENRDNQLISLNKLPLALIFVGAVGVLAALVFVERKIAKKKK